MFEFQDFELKRDHHRVLSVPKLRLLPGWTAVVGPNGAGKSSLLSALAGLWSAHGTWRHRMTCDGELRREGAPWLQRSASSRAQTLAWLGQAEVPIGDLTVRQTVALGRLPYLGLLGTMGAADERAVDRAMSWMGCTDWQYRQLNELSGGERQRALIARVMASEAQVLLLDEPSNHLDPPQQRSLVRGLRQFLATEPPRMVLSVLHDLNLAALADYWLVIDAGRVTAYGALSEEGVRHAASHAFGDALAFEHEPGAAASVAWRVALNWFD